MSFSTFPFPISSRNWSDEVEVKVTHETHDIIWDTDTTQYTTLNETVKKARKVFGTMKFWMEMEQVHLHPKKKDKQLRLLCKR